MKISPGKSTRRGSTLFGALACVLASGCATIDNGNYGVPVDAANRPQASAAPPPLLVSAGEAPSYSSRYLGLVEVTFENRTSVWKQVDRVALSFGSATKSRNIAIASGEEIEAWERAITIGRAIALTNAGTGIEALGRVPVDRLGAWVDQRHPAAAAAGTTDAGAPAGVGSGAVPTPPSYPDQHLLTTPFRIPPGLFTKRWILLSTSDDPLGGCIDSMVLSYETSDHTTGRMILSFKIRGTGWQPAACPAPLASTDRQM